MQILKWWSYSGPEKQCKHKHKLKDRNEGAEGGQEYLFTIREGVQLYNFNPDKLRECRHYLFLVQNTTVAGATHKAHHRLCGRRHGEREAEASTDEHREPT